MPSPYKNGLGGNKLPTEFVFIQKVHIILEKKMVILNSHKKSL